ncbi:hypothetical protein NPIL_65881 [Nephila pilipes]|uniref:DUF7041 domain-containing protein n=1 Tax=Nephila pilipes TaxID=299642 RepID=A0A8X6N6T1_NEPPI|nr:hypothetical protein NPIL_65881 [Nephila pilipes]
MISKGYFRTSKSSLLHTLICIVDIFNSKEADHPNTSRVLPFQSVAFTPPPFWEEDPKFWFFQINIQFIMAVFTREFTYFHVVVGVLETKRSFVWYCFHYYCIQWPGNEFLAPTIHFR